jgi:serine/threonine-protein kinase/endoribonuclease IRE1
LEFVRTDPSKITKVGDYILCFREEFEIGSGSDGTTVYIGLGDDGSEVAVKRFLLNRSRKFANCEKNLLNTSDFRNEQHIVKYRSYYDNVDRVFGYLVLDLCEENLKEYVLSEEHDNGMLRSKAPVFMRQILNGLKALHNSEPPILHRDMKPSNILITNDDKAVLADFDISQELGSRAHTHKSNQRGTEDWIAVESLQTNPKVADASVRYKKESDIQVTGMSFFFILTKGEHPYGDENYRKTNLIDGKPVNLHQVDDPAAKDLIQWMIQHKPEDRPSVEECLKHPYLLDPVQQFQLLKVVGNEREVKKNESSQVVFQQLNADPLLPTQNWKAKIDADVLKHLTAGRSYTDDIAGLLRFIRNVSEHWSDKKRPTAVEDQVGTPMEYFLKLFPNLPFVVHKTIRKTDWKERKGLKDYF